VPKQGKKRASIPPEVLAEPGLEPVYPEVFLPVGRAVRSVRNTITPVAKSTIDFFRGNEAFDLGVDAAQPALRHAGMRTGGRVKPRGVGLAVRGFGNATKKRGKK